VLHIHLLHAPDFLGYESGIAMATDYRAEMERGLRLKKIGNEIVEVVGGRAVHPVNVKVGGSYGVPTAQRMAALATELDWALQAAVDVARWVATLPMPEHELPDGTALVALRHPTEYPMLGERLVAASLPCTQPGDRLRVHRVAHQVVTAQCLGRDDATVDEQALRSPQRIVRRGERPAVAVDELQARTAVRAGDERVAVAAVRRVEQFAQAVAAHGQIQGQGRGRTGRRARRGDAETDHTGQRRRRHGDAIHPRHRRCLRHQPSGQLIHSVTVSFHVDRHAVGTVPDGTMHSERGGEPV
jgi:hypothetical protein